MIVISKQTKKRFKTGLFALVLTSGQIFAQDASPTPVAVVNAAPPAAEEKVEQKELQEVALTGSRTVPRTVTSTPLPVDNISAQDMKSTGQPTFDKAMQYRVPSFNTVNTPVNDATTLLDPWEIRNLGPSRTLILVNGKRKNLSSLLYTQFSPGRGESGVDISGIPSDAIKNIEILRDGASAQYGSDAIAGVVNIILKDKYDYTTLNLQGGITGKGDGEMGGISLNSGANFGNKGFVNYTVALQKMANAVRSGIVSAEGEKAWKGGDAAKDKLIDDYLKVYPTANNINGTGDVTASKFLINAGIPVSNNLELYANGAFVYKKVISNANYRTPYWVSGTNSAGVINNPFAVSGNYIGYMPTFEGDLKDYNATIGAKHEVDGWKTDASITVGGNEQVYTVNNTFNHALGLTSPISFKPGGYKFDHIVGNLDISKSILENLSVGLGTEIRAESFEILAGDTASYKQGGANSFPGTDIRNATLNTRVNAGIYGDVSYDIEKMILLNGTVRYESYSDFGDAFVYKLSTRINAIKDLLTIRGSYSTGFRAPSLHQIYQQTNQASFQDGQIKVTGLFNNKSLVAKQLGVENLKAEKSTNITAGIGLTPNKNFTITLDYYNINIKDRIVLSSTIKGAAGSTLGNILSSNGIDGLAMFINGIETNTQGLDFVAAYKNIMLGSGAKLAVNFSGNYMLNNEIVGSPNDPATIKNSGSTILSPQIRSLLTESRPIYKFLLGFDVTVDKFAFNLNNTLFGPTKFVDTDNGGSAMSEDQTVHIKQVFKPAVVTDLTVTYNASKKVSLSFVVNNILNVLPSWDLEAQTTKGSATLNDAAKKRTLINDLTFNGRYSILAYNGAQFSQLGTQFFVNLTVRF